jgi:hypothetical protein
MAEFASFLINEIVAVIARIYLQKKSVTVEQLKTTKEKRTATNH